MLAHATNAEGTLLGWGETGLLGRAASTAWSQAAPSPRAGFSPGSIFELV